MGQEGANACHRRPNHRSYDAGSQFGLDDRQSQGFPDAATRPLPAALRATSATLYLNRIMAEPDKPPGYQPTTGRKLFMFGLCVAGLIFVWTYYYFATRSH